MILRSPDAPLPARARAVLSRWQRELDVLPTYAKKVAAAAKTWPGRNRKGNKTFDLIKERLDAMCVGARRCSYCEDSYADEVEHVWPKSLYPDRTYVWRNLLYACGPCNGPKNNQFAVIAGQDPVPIVVTRGRRYPVTPPRCGQPAFVDPRTEDPLQFFELDIQGTFFFLPMGEEGSVEYLRADYTIETLKLNARDALVAARKNAFKSYRARLQEYIVKRDEGTLQRSLQRLVRNLQEMHHPFVWAEMKRSGSDRNDLRRLFQQAPEALDW